MSHNVGGVDKEAMGPKMSGMHTARISFPYDPAEDPADVQDRAIDLVSMWYKNGQIIGKDWPCTISTTTLDILVTIPEEDALAESNGNKYTSKELKELGSMVPEVTVLGLDPFYPAVCECGEKTPIILFTTYDSCLPPVRCLECFNPVPLYRLPHVHDHEHLVILQWASDYRSCDSLQMNCTTGERFGETQMSDLESSLSRNGRSLANDLERLGARPVYYYLTKFRSKSRKLELARRCPGCGGKWLLDSPVQGCDFQCKACRIFSSVASDLA